MDRLKTLFERWWMVLLLVICLPFFYDAAVTNEHSINYANINNGFFTFWLAGHITWTGGHPYSATEWVAGHHANGATWIPNQIFPYPLPLALITVPLGALPIQQAYILWGLLSQILVVVAILIMSSFWEGVNRRLLVVLMLVAVILNSNVHLMLLTGTIGSLFLIFLVAALYFKQKNWDVAAGMALALMALKPPLLTIVALIGLWLLLCRNWKMIAGIIFGGLALLGVGMIQDVNWVAKFRGASENLFNMRVGSQPTIISYTRLACNGELTCALSIYIFIVLVLVGLYIWLISRRDAGMVWKKRDTLTPFSVFSAAIALGVLLPPYIWSYDYVLLVIPLCYICIELVRRTRSYIQVTLYLLVLDVLSLGAVTFFSMNPESSALTIQRDMLSIWIGILVLVPCWWMIMHQHKREVQTST